MDGYEITVKDLKTGDVGTRTLYDGDFFLATTGECYLSSTVRHATTGTTQLTIKKHFPTKPPEDGS